jgi:hypothetical protein
MQWFVSILSAFAPLPKRAFWLSIRLTSNSVDLAKYSGEGISQEQRAKARCSFFLRVGLSLVSAAFRACSA